LNRHKTSKDRFFWGDTLCLCRKTWQFPNQICFGK